MKTVLVFAHECAPYHRRESTAGAQRPAAFAKYLPEHGWRAIVLCCARDERGTALWGDLERVGERAAAALDATPPAESAVIPTPSLAHHGALDRLWRHLTATPSRSRLRLHLRKMVTAVKIFDGDYSSAWRPCAEAAAAAIAARQHVHAVIAEHSPDASLFLARWFCGLDRTPWLVDFRDPILAPFRQPLRSMYRPFARWLVEHAAGTINVNPILADADSCLFGKPSWSIPNGFDPEEFDHESARSRDALTITYLGNIIPEQDLDVFLEGLALALRRDPHEPGEPPRLLFVYRGLADRFVSDRVRRAGLAEHADVSGYVPRSEALRLMLGADLLLALSARDAQRHNHHLRHGVVPAKVFEYLGARRPILNVPGDAGLLDALVEETGAGVTLSSPREIAAYLTRLAAMKDEAAAPAAAVDGRRILRYSRAFQAGQLAKILDDIVSPP
ncbi:MAG TPA: hypothetical protein VNB06_08360 [Thermoanaerobaculia bacterium]|nr:hypothetical protein [Thermoanaerobaculia bacterium]